MTSAGQTGMSFAETAQTVMERAENSTEADKEVKGREASGVLDSIAEHAPEEVRQAGIFGGGEGNRWNHNGIWALDI